MCVCVCVCVLNACLTFRCFIIQTMVNIEITNKKPAPSN